MTQNVKLIAVIALGGGAVYILTRRGASGNTVLQDLISPQAAQAQSLIPARGPGNTSSLGPGATPRPGSTAIGLIGASTAAVGSLLAAGGGTAAAGAAAATAAAGGAAATGGTTAAAVGGGIGTAATIGITAGIGGAVLLTWAVWKKGLFRGGEEALHVNGDRDQFLLQFGPPGWQMAADGRGISGAPRLAGLLTEITGQPNGSQYFTDLMKADTVKEFVAACRAIQSLLAQRGITIQAP